MKQVLILTFMAVFSCWEIDLNAQNGDEYIYGTLVTKSNERYTGFMRWGKEELAWHDVFNSVKIEDKHAGYRSHESEDKSLWKDFSWNISSIWEDKYRETSHTFACLFGDIRSIYPKSGSKLELELKNGTVLKLEGGSNDVGGVILVEDYELGLVKISWSKIKSIHFEQAPYLYEPPFGDLIYGKVYTYRKGVLEGFIKWDLDERAGHDIINGYTSEGEQEIEFRHVKAIRKHENGCYITLNSGREFFIKGTNDVNSGNRGIAVYNHDVGRIEISWKEFKKLEIIKNRKKGPSYNDFNPPMGILAKVRTFDDQEHKGLIVYDIDEKWEIELIDGDDDYVKYQIPFRNVKSIYPKNKSYSIVYLKNGDQLLLGERQDVSGNNDGLLLFIKSEKNPRHIKWSEVIEINID